MKIVDIAEKIWKRSSDPKHPDNCQDEDWQEGFATGRTNESRASIHEDHHPITIEWKNRGCPDRPDDRFRSWKAGFWAGTFSKLGDKFKASDQKETA